MDDDVEAAPFHHQWSKVLLKGKKHFVTQGFRESAKTTYMRSFVLHCLAYPQRKMSYIVFIHANQRIASSRLESIVQQYMQHPYLKHNVVEVRTAKFSDGVVELVLTDLNGRDLPVRIEAYGKGASIRGLLWGERRPDIVVVDDPQDRSDSDSQTTLDRDWEWFLSEIMFLGEKTRFFVIGNNLGDRCIVERLFQASETLGFSADRLAIWDEKENPSWPAKFTHEFIVKEREKFRELGKLDIWYMERLCNPVSPQSQYITKDLFKYYDPEELEIDNMNIYTTVDPALSEKQSADFFVITTVAVDKDENWFVLDVAYGREDPSTQIDLLFQTHAKWRSDLVAIESNAWQGALRHFVEKEQVVRKRFFRIEPLKHFKDKALRILGALQPRFKAGKIWFPARAPFLAELESELLMMTPAGTRAAHDDLADCLAMIDEIALPPSWDGFLSEKDKVPVAGVM